MKCGKERYAMNAKYLGLSILEISFVVYVLLIASMSMQAQITLAIIILVILIIPDKLVTKLLRR